MDYERVQRLREYVENLDDVMNGGADISDQEAIVEIIQIIEDDRPLELRRTRATVTLTLDYHEAYELYAYCLREIDELMRTQPWNLKWLVRYWMLAKKIEKQLAK